MKKFLSVLLMVFALTSLFAEEGLASWYTSDRPGALTANGDVFDSKALTAAHKSLKFGSKVKVTNLENGNSVEVRINDRGPYVEGRIIDLTPEAAKQLGIYKSGVAKVSLEVTYEPENPETKYINGAETGWYTIQIGSYTNIASAYEVSENLKKAGIKPTLEIINEAMVRISVANIQAYKLDDTLGKLAKLGISDPLVKGAKNPYL